MNILGGAINCCPEILWITDQKFPTFNSELPRRLFIHYQVDSTFLLNLFLFLDHCSVQLDLMFSFLIKILYTSTHSY